MLGDHLKIFVYGLPLDCQEDSLKNFLEAVCDDHNAVSKVCIPPKKSFAFVTLSCAEAVQCLLLKTLLYCDSVGQVYHVKACPYVRKPFRNDCKCIKKTQAALPIVKMEPKPFKYTPQEHVKQFSPDYSMLSQSKPKRRKRKRDDSLVWFGGVGSTSYRKRTKHQKKKKKVHKVEFHKNESFQIGNLSPVKNSTPADIDESNGTTKADSLVHENDHELGEANQGIPAVKILDAEDQMPASSVSLPVQVIVDHDYVGPLCLQFTGSPSVADVKNEIMEQYGLPAKDQSLYCNAKKLCDELSLRPLLNNTDDSLTLTLFLGSLKGGAPPKKAPDKSATGGENASSSTQQELSPEEATDKGAIGGKQDSSASGLEGTLSTRTGEEDGDVWRMGKTGSTSPSSA